MPSGSSLLVSRHASNIIGPTQGHRVDDRRLSDVSECAWSLSARASVVLRLSRSVRPRRRPPKTVDTSIWDTLSPGLVGGSVHFAETVRLDGQIAHVLLGFQGHETDDDLGGNVL